MKPVILTSFEHAGAIWTACLCSERRVQVASGFTLMFVRDWIVGGTRRVLWPASAEVMRVLSEELPAVIERVLHDELRRALALNPVRSVAVSGTARPHTIADEHSRSNKVLSSQMLSEPEAHTHDDN